MRNLKLKLGVIVLVNASLFGCGGGSSGNDNAAGGTAGTTSNDTSNSTASAGSSGASYSAISQAKYETAAATAVGPLGELTNVNGVTGALSAGVEVDAPSLSLASASIQIYKRFSAKNSQLVAGVTTSEPCSGGGSVTIDESVVSDSKLTAGDRIAFTANNCVEDGLPPLNGKMSIIINAVTGDPVNTDRYTLSFTANYTNLAVTSGTRSVLINGDLTVNASKNGTSATSVTLSGNQLGLSVKQSGTTTNAYSLANYKLTGTENGTSNTLDGNYTLSGSSSSLGDYSYRVQTLKPVVVSSSGAFLSGGSVLVTGAPATITVTSLDGTSVRIDYSANGNGVITATSSLTRSQFNALN